MRSGFLALVLAVALAGCQASLEDLAPREHAPLPPRLVQVMKAKGMTRQSPIMVRIFKEEGVLEVWKQKDNGRYDLVTSYDICKWSGKLGPKFREGDRQAPEGFYTVNPWQMNPKSSYYLAFNIGYPNVYDRHHGRTGSHLMVHGACSSAGCYSMTDEQMKEIYAFARDAFKGGQTAFQIQAFPFRMTPENMARYRDDPNYKFWEMLKEGYDHFELTKVPPKVDVCEGRYVFNRTAAGKLTPDGACPPAASDKLLTAYSSHASSQAGAIAEAMARGNLKPPAPSIRGIEEAILVAKWSAARARGEKVTPKPPSLEAPEILLAEVEKKRELEQRKALAAAQQAAARQLAAEKAAAEKAAAEQQQAAAQAEPVATAFAPEQAAANGGQKRKPWWNPLRW
jgi:murein L,D-transpeptidase YafK